MQEYYELTAKSTIKSSTKPNDKKPDPKAASQTPPPQPPQPPQKPNNPVQPTTATKPNNPPTQPPSPIVTNNTQAKPVVNPPAPQKIDDFSNFFGGPKPDSKAQMPVISPTTTIPVNKPGPIGQPVNTSPTTNNNPGNNIKSQDFANFFGTGSQNPPNPATNQPKPPAQNPVPPPTA
jgi:hypothetical protein